MNRWTGILALVAATLMVGSAACAATSQLGVKGGIAIQKWGGDDIESDDNVENRTGFVGGAYYQCDFNRNFGLRVEGLYFMKGSALDVDSVDVDVTFKTDYIEFPVLLMGHIPLGETARLSIFGGPTFGFNVNSEVELSAFGLSASADIGDGIETFEFGLTFGAGLGFDVGPVVLGVDGRYGFGLTSIASDDFGETVFGVPLEDVDITNQGFAFMASVGFPLGAE